jgi:hypothetical protein
MKSFQSIKKAPIFGYFWGMLCLFSACQNQPDNPETVKPLGIVLKSGLHSGVQVHTDDFLKFSADLYPDSFRKRDLGLEHIKEWGVIRNTIELMPQIRYVYGNKNDPMEPTILLENRTYALIPSQSTVYVRRYELVPLGENDPDNGAESFSMDYFVPSQTDTLPVVWINKTENIGFVKSSTFLFKKQPNKPFWDLIFRVEDYDPPKKVKSTSNNLFTLSNSNRGRSRGDANTFLFRIEPDTMLKFVFAFGDFNQTWAYSYPTEETTINLHQLRSPYYREVRALQAANKDSMWVEYIYEGGMVFQLTDSSQTIDFAGEKLNSATHPRRIQGYENLAEEFYLPISHLFIQPLYGDTLQTIWAWNKSKYNYELVGFKSITGLISEEFFSKKLTESRRPAHFGYADLLNSRPDFAKKIYERASPLQKAGLDGWEANKETYTKPEKRGL